MFCVSQTLFHSITFQKKKITLNQHALAQLDFAWGCSKCFTKIFNKIESLFKGLETHFFAVGFHLLITFVYPPNEGEGKKQMTCYFWCYKIMTFLPSASVGALVIGRHQHLVYLKTSHQWLLTLGTRPQLTDHLGHLQYPGMVSLSSPRSNKVCIPFGEESLAQQHNGSERRNK